MPALSDVVIFLSPIAVLTFKSNRSINSKWAIFELCHCCIQWAVILCAGCRQTYVADVEMLRWAVILFCKMFIVFYTVTVVCVCDLLHVLLALWQLWIHVMCVCMYVCMYVRMYVYVYVCTYACSRLLSTIQENVDVLFQRSHCREPLLFCNTSSREWQWEWQWQ
jgi:hypothetical protein